MERSFFHAFCALVFVLHVNTVLSEDGFCSLPSQPVLGFPACDGPAQTVKVILDSNGKPLTTIKFKDDLDFLGDNNLNISSIISAGGRLVCKPIVDNTDCDSFCKFANETNPVYCGGSSNYCQWRFGRRNDLEFQKYLPWFQDKLYITENPTSRCQQCVYPGHLDTCQPCNFAQNITAVAPFSASLLGLQQIFKSETKNSIFVTPSYSGELIDLNISCVEDGFKHFHVQWIDLPQPNVTVDGLHLRMHLNTHNCWSVVMIEMSVNRIRLSQSGVQDFARIIVLLYSPHEADFEILNDVCFNGIVMAPNANLVVQTPGCHPVLMTQTGSLFFYPNATPTLDALHADSDPGLANDPLALPVEGCQPESTAQCSCHFVKQDVPALPLNSSYISLGYMPMIYGQVYSNTPRTFRQAFPELYGPIMSSNISSRRLLSVSDTPSKQFAVSYGECSVTLKRDINLDPCSPRCPKILEYTLEAKINGKSQTFTSSLEMESFILPQTMCTQSGLLYVYIYAYNTANLFVDVFQLGQAEDCGTRCLLCFNVIHNFDCADPTQKALIYLAIITLSLLALKLLAEVSKLLIILLQFCQQIKVLCPNLNCCRRFCKGCKRISKDDDGKEEVNLGLLSSVKLEASGNTWGDDKNADTELQRVTADVSDLRVWRNNNGILNSDGSWTIKSDKRMDWNTRIATVSARNPKYNIRMMLLMTIISLLSVDSQSLYSPPANYSDLTKWTGNCDNGIMLNTKAVDCKVIEEKYICSIGLSLVGTIPTGGVGLCMDLIDAEDSLPIGRLKVSVETTTITQGYKAGYATAEWRLMMSSSKHCDHTDCCGSASIHPDSNPCGYFGGDNDPIMTNPGRSFGHTSCGCAGCGCFYCSNGCTFTRWALDVRRNPPFQVFTKDRNQLALKPNLRIDFITGPTLGNVQTLYSGQLVYGDSVEAGDFIVNAVGTLNDGSNFDRFPDNVVTNTICPNNQCPKEFKMYGVPDAYVSPINAPQKGKIGDVQFPFSGSVRRDQYNYASDLVTCTESDTDECHSVEAGLRLITIRNVGQRFPYNGLSVLPGSQSVLPFYQTKGVAAPTLLNIKTMRNVVVTSKQSVVCPRVLGKATWSGYWSSDRGCSLSVKAYSTCESGQAFIRNVPLSIKFNTMSVDLVSHKDDSLSETIVMRGYCSEKSIRSGLITLCKSSKCIDVSYDASLLLDSNDSIAPQIIANGTIEINGKSSSSSWVSGFSGFFDSIIDFFNSLVGGSSLLSGVLSLILFVVLLPTVLYLSLSLLIRTRKCCSKSGPETIRNQNYQRVNTWADDEDTAIDERSVITTTNNNNNIRYRR